MTAPRALALLLTALAAAGGARAQQPPPADTAAARATQLPNVRRVMLQEALELARRNNPAMVQAQQNVRVSDMATMQAWGAYLPSVSGSMSTSKSGQRIDATTGSVTRAPLAYNDRYGLSASVPVFTGFQRGANRRLANANVQMNEAALINQRYTTDLATKQAFFNALATQELVTVAETQVRRSQEQLKLTSEKLRLGATTRADSLQAQVDYGTQQLALIQAQANAQNAQATLARAVGVVGSVAAVPDTMLEVRIASLDTASLRREALANAPAVVQAEAGVTASRASVAVSRASYMPTITASGSTSWARADSVFLGGQPFSRSWQVALQLSLPIFNGFSREAQLVQADANLVTAQARLRDARLLLDANLTQALAALDAAARQIDVSRTQVAAAQENLRMQRERYRLGASTIVDMLTAEVSTNQAEVGLVQARYSYLVARAQLEAYVGHAL